jgi:hypothetical protein
MAMKADFDANTPDELKNATMSKVTRGGARRHPAPPRPAPPRALQEIVIGGHCTAIEIRTRSLQLGEDTAAAEAEEKAAAEQDAAKVAAEEEEAEKRRLRAEKRKSMTPAAKKAKMKCNVLKGQAKVGFARIITQKHSHRIR